MKLLAVLVVLQIGVSLRAVTSALYLREEDADLPNNRTARETLCQQNEYRYKGRCCKMCPKGTYVARHCFSHQTQGTCESCTSGEDFTEYANGLTACITCNYCREDQVTERECSPTTNAICQCKSGTFCVPGEACESCITCSSCGPGQRVKVKCTSTSNTVCEHEEAGIITTKTDPNYTTTMEKSALIDVLYWLIPLCITVFLIIFIIAAMCYKSNNNGNGSQSGGNDVESKLLEHGNSLVTVQSVSSLDSCTPEVNPSYPETEQQQNGGNFSPSAPPDPLKESVQIPPTHAPEEDPLLGAPQPSPQCEGNQRSSSEPGAASGSASDALTTDNYLDCFYTFIEVVPHRSWKEFMRRLNLKDTEIESYPNIQKEAKYQMLLSWWNEYGKVATIGTLLHVLDRMNLGGCKDNIINDLKSKGILPSGYSVPNK
ncbi:tumor necrosis factor receptor superfamily member 10B-like isoform 2-T2 [Discoglossus pictus]